jgi:energy-converting hydrogenase A subunit M
MQKEELIDLAKELKSDEENKAITLFEEFAKNNNISQEELEQILSKQHDCFKCESCHTFYSYEEYSYFDEKCIYCCDTDDEEEEF